MLVKEAAKTPEGIIQFAQLAASKMSVTLLQAAENIKQGRDRDTEGIIRNITKQLQEDMTEWMVS